jgi:hypothetical protein
MTPMVDTPAVVLASLLCVSFGSFASDVPKFSEIRETYLMELKNRNIPVFVSGCALHDGMSLLMQPAGGQPGKYVELYWKNGDRSDPSVINAANVKIRTQEYLGEILHGGLQTWRVTNSAVNQLINSPFQLLRSNEFDRIINLRPTKKCNTRDPG